MMNFLNPVFLAMLAAVGVPLLIHLLSRRKVREIPFSTLKFIRKSDRRSMRRINIRKILLLLIRMAAIALVAMAFARPVIKGSLAALFPGDSPRAVCLLLDRSYSMAVRENDGSVFDRAKGAVTAIAASLGEEDDVSIVLVDSGAEKVFEGEKFKPGPAVELLEDAEPSFMSTDLAGGIDRSLDILASSRRETKELYVISDFQRSGAGKKTRERELKVRTLLVPVQPGPGPNVSIDAVLTPRVVIHRGEMALIRVALRNHSDALPARFPLRIDVDGKRVVEKEIELGPGSSRVEEMDVPVERVGWIRGIVSKREDRLDRDDRRYFTIQASEKTKVLLIEEGNSSYLRQALSPEGSEGDIELRKRKWKSFVTADLDWADAVVAGAGARPGSGETALLEDFADRGGRILVFVTKDTEELVTSLSGHGPEVIFDDAGERTGTVAEPAGKPDFLLPFGKEDLENLSRARFSGVPEIRGVPKGDVLLSYRSGTPFIWRERRESGAIMFAVFDPSLSGGDFVLSPLFLPLVQQAVLAMNQDEGSGEGVLAGEELVFRGIPGEDYSLLLPGGLEFRPEWKNEGEAVGRIGTGERFRGGNMVLNAGKIPGFADLVSGADTVLRVAVNPDCRLESDLDFMSGQEAADSLGLDNIGVINEGERIEAGIATAREGREISTFLIAAAILLFVSELVIAQKRDMAVAEK